jgi:citrate synthase
MRARLEDAYSIPRDAWALRAGYASSAAPVTSSSSAAVLALAGGKRATTLQDTVDLLTSIQAARRQQGLMPAEQIKLADTEARILGLKHRLEREHELLEDRIVREHPSWLRLRRTLIRILAKHPEAAREVDRALAELEGDGAPPKSTP